MPVPFLNAEMSSFGQKRTFPARPFISRALEIAEKKIGMEDLVRRLLAPDTTVRAWRDGHATMPERKFLLLVDVLSELDPSWNDWDAKP